MQNVKVEVVQQEKASRVELLVRLVYWIPLAIVQFFVGIIAIIAFFVSIFSILILGKRILGLTKFIGILVAYKAKMDSYFLLATDERPPIIPEELK